LRPRLTDDFLAQITFGPDCFKIGGVAMASPASVLIVDDDPATLIALPDMLTARLPDVSVDTCESAITGLQALRDTNYCVVIADLRMPEMDGLTLLRKVRQLREHTPVVVMSGVTEWGLAKRASEAGAFAFVQKPFERLQFSQTVRLAIQCGQMRERVMYGKRRLARLSELLRRAQSLPLSAHAEKAFKRMEQAERGGKTSIARIERLITTLTEHLRPQGATLWLLEEQARTQAKHMLHTLGE
jgi:DNA-binding NtrC family response regulator